MPDFGKRLREARERRGVSLRQIAERTKVSVAALEALERNDQRRLPGGIFSRALVRSYAAEVGLDPEEAVRDFVECFNLEPPFTVASLDRALEGTDGTQLSTRRFGAVLLKIVVASLVAVAILLYLARVRHADDASGAGAAETVGRTSGRVALSSHHI